MKLKHMRIYSVGFLARYAKICTKENFPLYGTWEVGTYLRHCGIHFMVSGFNMVIFIFSRASLWIGNQR